MHRWLLERNDSPLLDAGESNYVSIFGVLGCLDPAVCSPEGRYDQGIPVTLLPPRSKSRRVYSTSCSYPGGFRFCGISITAATRLGSVCTTYCYLCLGLRCYATMSDEKS